MRQYLELLQHILDIGVEKDDRQGVGNLCVAGYQMRFDLSLGAFPLITTRKVAMKPIVAELLWFLSGSSHVRDLHTHGVHFWDPWAKEEMCLPYGRELGDVGPIYGPQWRAWKKRDGGTIDQIATLVENLRNDPYSRRHMVTTWNPEDVPNLWLAPCHGIFHCIVIGDRLNLHLFQRSADAPIGVPFNIASYALLLLMLAQVTGLKPGEFIHTLSDVHIYKDQVDGVRELLKRDPRSLPNIHVNPAVTDIFDFKIESFVLTNYNPHPALSIPVAV